MLKFAQIEARQQELAALLPELVAGRIECIEYGKPGERYLSYLRVRYIQTAGGVQFQIRRVNTLGVEGSGDYTPDAADALRKAMDAVLHYHRPAPPRIAAALHALAAKNGAVRMDELSFFAVANESTEPKPWASQGLSEWEPHRDAVVIDLAQQPASASC